MIAEQPIEFARAFFREEDLGDATAAVVADQVDLIDLQRTSFNIVALASQKHPGPA
jgi:hypothetical protein